MFGFKKRQQGINASLIESSHDIRKIVERLQLEIEELKAENSDLRDSLSILKLVANDHKLRGNYSILSQSSTRVLEESGHRYVGTSTAGLEVWMKRPDHKVKTAKKVKAKKESK